MKDRYGHVRGLAAADTVTTVLFITSILKVVSKIAKRPGVNENVIAWQIDNEFGCWTRVMLLRIASWLLGMAEGKIWKPGKSEPGMGNGILEPNI